MTMEKLKGIGEYDKNAGTTVVLGRQKELPKGIDKKDMILVGDCLKKWRTHGVVASGCPPAEPFPLWAITDRQNYTEIEMLDRERMAREDVLFRKYIAKLIEEMEAKEGGGKRRKRR
jgi:hypothetical protein